MDEIEQLNGDSIHHTGLVAVLGKEGYLEFAMSNYVQFMLTPLSYAILLDFLASSMIACFTELGILLEPLTRCYYADYEFREKAFFQEKLTSLEERMRKENLSTSKLMTKLHKDAVVLWGILSEDRIHTKGLVNKIIETIEVESDVPAWALAILTGYNETDKRVIVELHKRLSVFPKLLNIIIEEWKRKVLQSAKS